MALMERVTTLIRANLNDLVDKAENPEKMLKQLILDMHNQLIQVKTQVAIAMADQHLLAKKQKENEERDAEWVRKAELAVDKREDDLARAALERSLSYRTMAANFQQQSADQAVQVENLKGALRSLEQKLAETQGKCDLLIAQQRRARALNKTQDTRMTQENTLNRIQNKTAAMEALGMAKAELTQPSLEDRFASLERQDEVERLLSEIKSRKVSVTLMDSPALLESGSE
jgi:phage shock protein A